MSHALNVPKDSRPLLARLAVLGIVAALVAAGVAWHSAHHRHTPVGALPVVAGSVTPAPGLPVAGTPSPTRHDAQPVGHTATPTQPVGGSPAAPSPTPTVPAGSTSPIGPGSYRVGIDIRPGDWTTGGLVNLDLGVCTYSVNGAPAVKILVSVGSNTVNLGSGDTFTTSGCQAWHWS